MAFNRRTRLCLCVLLLCTWCSHSAQGYAADSIDATARQFRHTKVIDSAAMQRFAGNCLQAGAITRFMEVYDTACTYTGAWNTLPHDITFLESMDSVLQKQHNTQGITAYRIHLFLADIYSFLSLKSGPALSHIDRAIAIANRLNDTCLVIETSIIKSSIYIDVLNDDLQTGITLNNADRLAKQMGYKSFCHCDAPYELNYAALYTNLENYPAAIGYLNAAIKRFTDKTENGKVSQNGRLYYCHMARAQAYIHAGSYDKATGDLDTAQHYAGFAPDTKIMFNSINSERFIALYLQGNTVRADSLAETIDYSTLDKATRASIEYLYHLARLRIGQHRFSDAEKILRDFEQVQDAHTLGYYVYLDELEYLLNKEEQNIPAAIGYLEQASRFKDSLHTATLKKAAISEQIRYETSQKDQQILIQNNELNNSRQEMRIVLISCGALLLLLLLIVMYRSNRNMREKNRLIQSFTRQLIDSREQEQNRLAHEMHDGIGQELMLIRNSLESNKDNRHAAMLTDSIENIRAISRDLFPALLESIGLKIATEQLLQQIDNQYELFVTADIEYEGKLDKYLELHLFRIIQEALNNTLKYAKAPSVKLSLHKTQNYVLLEIQDNGIGFNIDEAMKRNHGIGLMSMRQRAQAMNATFLIKSEKLKGTIVTIKLSLQ